MTPVGDSKTHPVDVRIICATNRDPRAGLIHHTDRGGQYAGKQYRRVLERSEIRQSMSGAGNCYDNAAMEAVWATIKREVRHLHGDWTQLTRSELRTILFDDIETFGSIEGAPFVYGHTRFFAVARRPT